MAKKMTDDELLAQMELLEKQAIGYYTSEVAADQAKAMDYYLGKPFGTEEEGRSQVISTDVRDVVEGLTPILLKPFLASDDVVKFNATGPEDEDAAKQESEYVNWVVTQRNDSFTQLVNWVKTGLLQKNGVVKYWWEKSSQTSVERHWGLDDNLWAMISQEPGVEVTEHTESIGPDGLPAHDVTLRITEMVGQAKYAVIPPEEFLVSRDADNPNPKTARFVQHRRMATIGAVRAMGYDIDDDIPDGADGDPYNSLQYLARRSAEEMAGAGPDEGNDPSAREVLLKETFWLVDADGDGVPELRKMCSIGKKILADEETEEIPFSGWTPSQQPFKFYGRCPADDAEEIQLVKSALLRLNMDNLYTTNNNRTYANDDVNLDDLIDNQIAGVVRVKGKGNVAHAVAAAEVTPIGGIVQPMLEYWDSAKENRTGYSRYNQGSADLSNQKTLGEVQIVTEQSNIRTELVTRSFANGLADLMRGIHGLCRRHATKAETVRLRGKWVEIDPRDWARRMDMSISVGIGAADSRTKMQGLQMLMLEQKQLAQLTQGTLVNPENMFNAASKLAETLGFKTPEEFFTMPQQQQELPPAVKQAIGQMQQQMQQLQQENQQLKSGIAAKMIDAQAKVHVEELKQAGVQQVTQQEHQFNAFLQKMKDDAAYDRDELKGVVEMLKQSAQPAPPELLASVTEDLTEENGGEEPKPAAPDAVTLLGQLVQAMHPPKRKTMQITGPSGAVYHGSVLEEPQMPGGDSGDL